MQKNLSIENLLDEYFKALNATYSTHDASEYSYRSALENLLNSLLQPEYQAINEPRNMTCGKPDISIIRKRDAVTVASIETKDINKPDLEGKGRNQEQFDRYKKAMNHAVFTDYLRFLFYESGNDTPILDICIGTCQNDEIVPDSEKGKQLCSFLRKYIGKKIQPIRSATILADLMAKKSQMMCAILTDLLKENGDDNASGLLKKTYTDLKESLIQNLDEDGFAKIYSQTVAYGLFAARLNDSTPENFSRAEAADLIPKTNKLLRGIFNDLAGNTIHERISWIIDDLVEMFGATNLQKMFERDIRNNRDPLIHFYEDFLKAFNSADRKNFGVWYTPLPIVKFIVDSIDILLKNKLSIEEGLADTTTIIHKTLDGETELSQVQILDPAVGTGTFLAEIINHIADQYKGQETLWQKYVHSCLLPRLYGFEIQMASYTVAHIKFDMVLAHTGYKTEKDDAFHICLTDSLRKPNKTGESNTGYWISLEQAEADRIKSQRPIMVMLGNPPYNGESQNKAVEIEELIEKYKQEPDQILSKKEKAKKIADTKWLNNDYVKFIALAQRFIEENGKGIIGYITPNTHLDSLTFRGMRYQLLKTFDNIYIINLHGSNKTKESCPDGSKDENVFGIESGVCITLFVKTGTEKGESSLAKVYYKDVYGKKKDKFDFLEQNDLLLLLQKVAKRLLSWMLTLPVLQFLRHLDLQKRLMDPKMEYILFDDCYMSSVEVAYEMKGVAHYIIACPTEIMSYGFPYGRCGVYLLGSLDYRNVVDNFIGYYSFSSSPYATAAVTDCTQLDDLADIVRQINEGVGGKSVSLTDVQPMDGYKPSLFFDFGDYIRHKCEDALLLEAFNAQLDKVVTYKGNTEYYYSALCGKVRIDRYSGLNTSESSLNTLFQGYDNTAWYKATHCKQSIK